jgi:mersacidin/lichenicidin family type 2 lantibiotic
MNSEQTIRAWKDEDYRLSLSALELSALPEHPAGLIELSDTDINTVAGQTTPIAPTAIVAIVTLAFCVPIVTVAVSLILGDSK